MDRGLEVLLLLSSGASARVALAGASSRVGLGQRRDLGTPRGHSESRQLRLGLAPTERRSLVASLQARQHYESGGTQPGATLVASAGFTKCCPLRVRQCCSCGHRTSVAAKVFLTAGYKLWWAFLASTAVGRILLVGPPLVLQLLRSLPASHCSHMVGHFGRRAPARPLSPSVRFLLARRG